MKKILLSLILLIFCFSCKNQEEINIVLDWLPNTNHTGIFVAKDKGYFDNLGIKVNIIIPSEDSSIPLVASSKYQFGISFQDSLAYFYSKKEKIPIIAIAALLQENTSGIVSLKEKNITSFKDLENKKYASWQDNIEIGIIKYLMENEKANFSKLKILPYSYDLIKSLKTTVDAAWIYYAWDGIALKLNGIDFNFLKIKQNPLLNYYTPVLIANTDFVNKNKKLTKDILKAIEKGYRYAINNPEEAANILINNYKELDKNLVFESQKWINDKYIDENNKWGLIQNDRWNNFYKWLYENNLIENEIEKNYGFTNKYLEK